VSNTRHDIAQICLNGHTINSMLQTFPEVSQGFCAQCGERTISTCRHCNEPIRGYLQVGSFIDFDKAQSEYSSPGFCHNCGKPYPCIEAKLQAAQELSDELDNLSEAEKETVKECLDDLVRDTPRTVVAAVKYKKLIAKAGEEAEERFDDLLADILTETAKKLTVR
jgi:hypothetical protein